MLLLSVLTAFPAAHADLEYSIPINGQYPALVIGLRIQTTPQWAHDIVLNASLVWNQAQVWYQQTNSSTGAVYTFVEAGNGSATVSFSMPQAYSGIAVGWTNYKFAPLSRVIISRVIIVSTQTFLDPNVFNSSQENNATTRQSAFWLALHELGRVLGLGSVLDGHDIMDPLWTPYRATPMLSTLDIYALHVLASGGVPNFVTLPSSVQNQLFGARTFLTPGVNSPNPYLSHLHRPTAQREHQIKKRVYPVGSRPTSSQKNGLKKKSTYLVKYCREEMKGSSFQGQCSAWQFLSYQRSFSAPFAFEFSMNSMWSLRSDSSSVSFVVSIPISLSNHPSSR
jgi:hypothetical protein